MSFVKKFLFVLCICGSLFSCSYSLEKQNNRIRIFVESKVQNTANVSVYFENSDGNAVNAALVYAKNTSNSYTLLEYSEENGCYIGKIEIPFDEKIYVIVDSILFSEYKEFEIPHTLLTEIPKISVFSDSSGNSVLSGDSLNSSEKIQIGWNFIDEDITYKIIIKDAIREVFSASTKSNTVIIPKDVLSKAKNYYVNIEAQKSFGDIFYRECNFYSVSICSGNSLGFLVE